jgi:predicted esterase
VDWARLSNFTYNLSAQRNTKIVGDYLATFIRYLQANGMSLSQTDIVGFSLGAHIAGVAGYNLNGQLKRIIGTNKQFTMKHVSN